MNWHNTSTWWTQATYNRLVACVLLMLVLVTLVATPAGHGGAALAYEGMALLLMILLLGRSPWKLSALHVRRFFTTGSHLPVAVFGVSATLSALTAGRNGYGEQALLCLGAGILLYYTVATQFRRATQLAKLVDTLVFLTIGLSLLGFQQYQSSHSMQAIGLYGDHQLFGSCLMVLLLLVGVHALTRKRPHRQTAAQVAGALGIAALLLSQARSAWIGAVAGLIFLAVTSVIRYRSGQTRLRRDNEILLPLIVLAVAAGFFLLLWPSTAGLISRATSLRKVTAVDTWQQRQATWAGVQHMIAARPWYGHGLGQYVIQQRAYTHQGLPLNAVTPGASLGELAHNFYLQTTAELGLVGLVLFVGILIAFWWTGLRRVLRMHGTIRRRLLLGSLASTVAFAVDAIASPSWQLPQVAMFLWLSLGIGVACQRHPSRMEDGQKEENEEEEATIPVRVSRPMAVLATAGFALLLPTVVFAYDSGYGTPISAALSPRRAMIAAGGAQSYTLTVTFSTGNSYDMTQSPGTTFSYILQTGGLAPGMSTGVNLCTYQSAAGENDVVAVTGTFNQNTGNNQGIVSDTGLLTITP